MFWRLFCTAVALPLLVQCTGDLSGGIGAGGAGGTGDAGGIGGGGTGGTSDAGGIGGGAGGASDPRPPCPEESPDDIVETCLLLDDGSAYPTSPTSPTSSQTTVTVVSVDDVPGGNCAAVGDSGSRDLTRRMILQLADGQRLTAYLRIPGLPQAFVAPNETLEVMSERGWDPWKFGGTLQTFVLSKGAQLLVFGFNGGRTLPMLEAFGVTVADGGSPCRVEGCARAVRDTRVTVGDVQAIVGQSQTVQVGDVSFTVEQHSFPETSSNCDGVYDLRMAGYRVPR